MLKSENVTEFVRECCSISFRHGVRSTKEYAARTRAKTRIVVATNSNDVRRPRKADRVDVYDRDRIIGADPISKRAKLSCGGDVEELWAFENTLANVGDGSLAY